MLTESVLLTVKKLIGVDETNTAFDADIIVAINSAFFVLYQLGFPDAGAFSITGENETWEDMLGSTKDFESIKTYVVLKVRQMFDPPSSSFVLTSIENQIRELEWRLAAQLEWSTPDSSSSSCNCGCN